MSILGSARTFARDLVDYGLGRLGRGDSEDTLIRDATATWADTDDPSWRPNSHWRDGLGDRLFESVGVEHRKLYERACEGLPEVSLPRVLEWGCGGGSNALTFARGASEFIGVEVEQDSLDETERQLARAGLDVAYTPVLVDVANPERALDKVAEGVDLYLSTYLLELVP